MEIKNEEIFLGKRITYDVPNQVKIGFNGDEYKSLLLDAHNAGFKNIQSYIIALAKPCNICGNDKVQIELLRRDLKKISNVYSVHLIIYSQSEVNSDTNMTPLSLGCEIASMLRVSIQSKVYTPKRLHSYTENKTDATITVFEKNVRGATINCTIKNNTLYPL